MNSGSSSCIIREKSETMKLKKQGAFLQNFVIDFANSDISRWEFDLDYSGYVIEHFPAFEQEYPRISRKVCRHD